NELNIEQKVIFLGPCPDIEKIYASGDLLIMPAIYEPFGNVCLEALASGIPVLISEFCGAKEVIKEKINGMVIRDLKNPRELAEQISKEFKSFSSGLGIHATTCIGGVSIRHQIINLDRNPHFVIGTPGRLLDLLERGKIDFGRFDSIVLDEVDRMLDMGFINDMNKIISKFPHNRQSLFFAATLGEKVRVVMRKFTANPVMISVKTAETRDNVHQDIIELKGRTKSLVLREVLKKVEVSKSLIFMRTKRAANSLHDNLSEVGFQTAVLHGNKSQNQRQRSLDRFRQGKVNILIATDVASRGLDINDISHVINYDLPESYEVYIHRIGRTGRADKKGVALTFVS
ncbi:DEAD/DEAH box helicase, partial [Patescibacteria group bacterium]|nr:DEAD/DEAH box helicase [Patescibacteria group bacterium]